jgi:hypothetical protein
VVSIPGTCFRSSQSSLQALSSRITRQASKSDYLSLLLLDPFSQYGSNLNLFSAPSTIFIPLRDCSVMFELLLMLLLCHFTATVVAEIASPPPENLPKPGVPPVPNWNNDFNALEKSQIIEGFRDAQYLASAAYEAVSSSPLLNSNPLTSD